MQRWQKTKNSQLSRPPRPYEARVKLLDICIYIYKNILIYYIYICVCMTLYVCMHVCLYTRSRVLISNHAPLHGYRQARVLGPGPLGPESGAHWVWAPGSIWTNWAWVLGPFGPPSVHWAWVVDPFGPIGSDPGPTLVPFPACSTYLIYYI